MYSHIAKGWTVGHTLARLLLRNITSIPGAILDPIIAIFWVPNYLSYWDDAGITYSDGVRVGFMRGLFGWIGEILGYAIGGVVGAIIGGALFIPNMILKGLAWLQRKAYSLLDDLALFIGESSFFEKFITFDKPENYMQKAWNLGSGILGVVIAAAPFAVAKIIEFFIPPLGVFLSTGAIKLGSLMGGAIIGVLALPLFLVKHIVARLMDGIDSIRDKILDGIAILYAKDDQTLVNDRNCCMPATVVHSADFRQRVRLAQASTWSQLLFGPLKNDVPVRDLNAGDELLDGKEDATADVITSEALGAGGKHIVIDKQGHSFNDDPNGIHKWLRDRDTCPIGRERLAANDLHRNYLAEQLVAERSAAAKR